MYIKFKKEHPVGILKGQVCKVANPFANKMIDEGYAKKSNEKDFKTFKNSLLNKGKVNEIEEKEDFEDIKNS